MCKLVRLITDKAVNNLIVNRTLLYNLENIISLIKKGIIIKYKYFPYKCYEGKVKAI